MDRFKPPDELNFEGNLNEHWKKWKQELDFYLVATEKDEKDEKVKSCILLTCIGSQGREVYNTFTFQENESPHDFELIIKKFDEHCSPRKNVTLTRYKFLTYKQKEGQSFSEFVTQLRKLSTDCELDNLRESLIKDVIVIGILDDRVRERLLRENNLTLLRAIEIGQSSEQTKMHAKLLRQEAEVSKINTRSYKPDYTQQNKSGLPGLARRGRDQGDSVSSSSSTIRNCKYCGGSHRRGNCPAYKQTCHNCKKQGHFASVCLSKSVKFIDLEDSTNDSEFMIDAIFANQHPSDTNNETTTGSKDEFPVVHSIADVTNEWSIELISNHTHVTYKIDTGAQVNVIPFRTFVKLNRRPKLSTSTIKLTAYNGTEIPVRGQCIININHVGKNFPLLFIVADTDSPSILGLKSCEKLNLISRVMEINSEFDNEIFETFNDCFGDLGTLPKTHHITINENVNPVVHAARRVPFALKDKLKSELDRMIKMNIIEPITEPTDWVNALVVVEKPNGKLRICLDPRDLNKAIKRHHYKLPSAEELFAEMSGATHFTKLDASNGYWQIMVDDESSKLLTFATPFGRFRFKRLPFGIHSASEIFQQTISEIIESCEGAKNSQDDIIIWGETKQQLTDRTVKVLEKIRKSGLKLNKAKCVFGTTEITFLGHKLSQHGISPDPEKVKAIREMPVPINKSDLQRFLGMVAYLAKFIPHLSNETLILRELIAKDAVWQFTENHIRQFAKVKNLISENILLKFFNPNLPTKITCDASKTGLGATLQ